LKAVENHLPGTVRLVFQPNEEFGAGGDHVVREGKVRGRGPEGKRACARGTNGTQCDCINRCSIG
jgi:metal-dependent amidase/aminoacylase/carboxypeptidase family protein